jgi:hypothetical protein
MPSYSMADIVNDPDFAEPFTIQRDSGGSWQAGVWLPNRVTVQGFGVVQPSTPKELDQIPEGDRVKGMKSFHSSAVLYETRGLNQDNTGLSDIIVYPPNSDIQWRVVSILPWENYGYYLAIAARMAGE